MSLLAIIVIVAFGLVLIGLTGIIFAKPVRAERFFMSFASSARVHYVEQAFRLLIGASLVVASPAMWQANLFWIIGWVIFVTAIGLSSFRGGGTIASRSGCSRWYFGT